MSAEQLARLDEERAFAPRGRFNELPLDYVPFDRLTGNRDVDARIDRALRAEEGCVTVVAPSGGGKSAVIAASVRRLERDFQAVRIPVAAVGEVAGDPIAFGQHILRETLRQAQASFEAHQRRDIERASADRVSRRGATKGVGAKLRAAIPGFSAELAADLKGSGIDRDDARNATEVVTSLSRLVGIFEQRGGPPILVFEDTDAWVGAPDEGDTSPVANQFFKDSVAVLMRDTGIRTIIATHTRYVALPGYLAIRDRLLSEITIPALHDAGTAIRAILQRRIDVSQVGGAVADVLTDDAIARLVAEYDHSDRSIRRVLQVCDTALEQQSPSYPESLSADHLRGAAVALSSGR